MVLHSTLDPLDWCEMANYIPLLSSDWKFLQYRLFRTKNTKFSILLKTENVHVPLIKKKKTYFEKDCTFFTYYLIVWIAKYVYYFCHNNFKLIVIQPFQLGATVVLDTSLAFINRKKTEKSFSHQGNKNGAFHLDKYQKA